MQVQEQFSSRSTLVVGVGFSPPAPLALLADTLNWQGPLLSDEQRVLYRLLGLPRARLLQTYSPGTLLRYARAAARGHRLTRPVEDTRQLGGDAVVVDGAVRVVWRPSTPDDRVDVRTIAAAVERLIADPH